MSPAEVQNVILQMTRFGVVRHSQSHCYQLSLTELGRRWLDSDEGLAVLLAGSS